MNQKERTAYDRAYYAAHKAKCATRGKVWRAAHKRETAAYHKAYRAAHKKEAAAYRVATRERRAACSHYHYAHNPAHRSFQTYRNMVFCPAWDTAKGTARAARVFNCNAAKWMKEHCPCPGKGWELHVDKTAKHPFGYFGPSGIRWMKKIDIHQRLELAVAIRVVERAGGSISWGAK